MDYMSYIRKLFVLNIKPHVKIRTDFYTTALFYFWSYVNLILQLGNLIESYELMHPYGIDLQHTKNLI
jgi:hypothetical protein